MRRLFLLVGAVILVDTMFYAAITPLLPTYRDELGLSKTAAGVLSASYAAGTLLGSLPVGVLIARLGPKPTMLAGLGLLSGSSVAFAFADTVVLLDAARFLRLDQGYAFALTNLAWAGGQVGGGAAGGFIAERAGDTVPYAAVAVLCSLTLAVLIARGRPAPAAAQRSQARS